MRKVPVFTIPKAQKVNFKYHWCTKILTIIMLNTDLRLEISYSLLRLVKHFYLYSSSPKWIRKY